MSRRRAMHIDDLPPGLRAKVRERAGIPTDLPGPQPDPADDREEARLMLVRLAGACISGRGDLPADGFPEYTNHQWLARMVKLTLGREGDNA